MQKMSSAMTEEVILEELQVFKVTFSAPLARQGAEGWAQVGDTYGDGGSGLSLHCWSLEGLRIIRAEGGWGWHIFTLPKIFLMFRQALVALNGPGCLW